MRWLRILEVYNIVAMTAGACLPSDWFKVKLVSFINAHFICRFSYQLPRTSCSDMNLRLLVAATVASGVQGKAPSTGLSFSQFVEPGIHSVSAFYRAWFQMNPCGQYNMPPRKNVTFLHESPAQRISAMIYCFVGRPSGTV